jgi:hypothetical protein
MTCGLHTRDHKRVLVKVSIGDLLGTLPHRSLAPNAWICCIDQRINGAYRHGMKGFRRHKRACVSLAIIALLGNALSMLALGKTASLADSVLGPLVVCAASGAKSVPGDPGPGGHPDHCPACTSIAPFVLAVGIVLIAGAFPTSIAGSRRLASDVCLLPLQVVLGGNRSRAPPLPV